MTAIYTGLFTLPGMGGDIVEEIDVVAGTKEHARRMILGEITAVGPVMPDGTPDPHPITWKDLDPACTLVEVIERGANEWF